MWRKTRAALQCRKPFCSAEELNPVVASLLYDLTARMVAEAGKAPEPAKAAPTPFDVAKFAGIFAAIGLAVGALGTALATASGRAARYCWHSTRAPGRSGWTNQFWPPR